MNWTFRNLLNFTHKPHYSQVALVFVQYGGGSVSTLGGGGGRRVGFPHRMTLTWGMFGVQSQRRRSGCSQQLDDRPMTQAAAPRRAAGTGQPCLVCFWRAGSCCAHIFSCPTDSPAHGVERSRFGHRRINNVPSLFAVVSTPLQAEETFKAPLS